MSRNNRKGIKKISIDLKYSSVFISKLINGLMLRGRKEIAQKIVYNSLFIISKTKKDIEINQFLERVIINISPIIEVKSRKVGGSIYQIPVSVIFKRQLALVIRFILCALRKRKEKQLEKRLA
ncbi:UNVERIFIED_CONTAM: hypothetical protein GTU68_026401, partial [Idotea baltica]|nr:hypothetical protein [Idotea baltica]